MGEQQRVEILKMLYRGARILIMDEPTAVLAPQEADELFATLRSMTAEGRSVVFISHKHSDRQIAETIARFVKNKSAGNARVHLSSSPDFEGPRFGQPINTELRHALGESDLVILVYTDDREDCLGGGELHTFGDPAGTGIERTTEHTGEGQHIVDLVREVTAPGRHDRRMLTGDVRVDLRVRMRPITALSRVDGAPPESTAVVRARVANARAKAAERWKEHGWLTNAQAPGPILRREFGLPRGVTALLDRGLDIGAVTARGADRCLRVSWTLADLAEVDQPTTDHVAAALEFRDRRVA